MKMFFYLIVFLGLLSCSSGEAEYSLESEVYEALFNEITQDAVKPIYINSERNNEYFFSVSLDELLSTHEELGDLPEWLLVEMAKPKYPASSLSWAPLMINATFIKLSDREDEWEYLRGVNPEIDGYYQVSEVQFNSSGTEAMLVLGYRCQMLCGANDTVVYLIKKDRSWRILKAVRLWVS